MLASRDEQVCLDARRHAGDRSRRGAAQRLPPGRAPRRLMPEAPPLEVRGLTKRFGSTTAVDELSFAIEPGRITGFLGPNGAGKTTTLRMLLGLVHPSAGQALVRGVPYRKLDDPVRTVGAVLEASSFHPARGGRNHLRVVATAAGTPREGLDATLVPAPDANRLREQVAAGGIEATSGEDGELRVAAPPERVGEAAAAAGIVLHELRAESASLEEAFLELTGGDE